MHPEYVIISDQDHSADILNAKQDEQTQLDAQFYVFCREIERKLVVKICVEKSQLSWRPWESLCNNWTKQTFGLGGKSGAVLNTSAISWPF